MQNLIQNFRFDIVYRILSLINESESQNLQIASDKATIAIIGGSITIAEIIIMALGELLIIIAILALVIILKQRKTQKMLRELQIKLDKLQPPSDPNEKNTEDTESAE